MITSDLKTRMNQEIYPTLAKKLGINNSMALPHIIKVVVNIGISKSDSTKKEIESARQELTAITGQLAKINRAKQSIAGFKLRQGDPIGVSVTLRGQRMFDFLDKLCKIVLPQVKDFRGVKKTAFDDAGNYTLGLTEQIIFPEINYAQVQQIRGLEITVVITQSNKQKSYQLLKLIGMPFEKDN